MSVKSTTFKTLGNGLPSELASATDIGPAMVVAVGLAESDLLIRL